MKTMQQIIAEVEEATHAISNAYGAFQTADAPEIERAFLAVQALENQLPYFYSRVRQWNKDRVSYINSPQNPFKAVMDAATKRDLEIPKIIKRLQRELDIKISGQVAKEAELRKAGVSRDKWAVLAEPVTDAQKQEVSDKIAALNEEQRLLEKFISSSPSYNVGFLKGTSLEHLIPA